MVAKDITEFAELNTNSLEKWIAIAKKVIRSARRKTRQDKQQRLTKFYSLQITPRNNNRTIEASTPPTSNKKQPSIITFFQLKQIQGTKERSDQNSRKERTINNAPRITVTNHTSPNPHSFIPNTPFQTHLNYPSNLTRQQPRNNYHLDDATPLKN